MKNFLDKLQQAWQSQCSKPIDVKPDQLLKVARLERGIYFAVDMLVQPCDTLRRPCDATDHGAAWMYSPPAVSRCVQ